MITETKLKIIFHPNLYFLKEHLKDSKLQINYQIIMTGLDTPAFYVIIYITEQFDIKIRRVA